MVEMKKSVIHRAKCVVCGDSTVGKSALIQVFVSDGAQYPKTYNMLTATTGGEFKSMNSSGIVYPNLSTSTGMPFLTAGVDLVVKHIPLPETKDSVELFLYDMAGKDVFEDIIDEHLHDVDVAAFIYDVSNERSFENIEVWVKKVQEKHDKKNIPGVLIANKIDLSDRQVITNETGEELAQRLGLSFFPCSAKDMRSTDTPFIHLAKMFYENKINDLES